jgi:hypothetical protein
MRRTTSAALGLGVAIASSSVVFVSSNSADAAPIPYTFQLQARASVGTGATTFNLPSGSAFSSATPDINNNRRVTFKPLLNGATGNEAIWYGGVGAGSLGTGGIVYDGAGGAALSDPSINNNNMVVFPQTFSSANGIYKFDAGTGSTTLFTNQPVGAQSWSSPRINNLNQVGTRANFGGNAQQFVSYGAAGGAATAHASSVDVDSTSPYSFLFTPNFDDNRNVYGVVRVGPAGSSGDATRPDQIRRFGVGASSIVVEDRDSNAASPYFQFDNSVGVSDNGQWVAFVARTTTAASSRSVFVTDGTTTRTVAVPGTGLTSIDNFTPAVNNSGLVTFRATDLSGRISVFVGDGTELQRVIGIGDPIQTDIGTFNINSMGGNPTINDVGDIAFGGGLGSGGNFIAVALAPEPGSVALVGISSISLVLRRRRD